MSIAEAVVKPESTGSDRNDTTTMSSFSHAISRCITPTMNDIRQTAAEYSWR